MIAVNPLAMLAVQCNKIQSSNPSPPLSPSKTSFYAWKKPITNPSMYPNSEVTSSCARINHYEHSLLNGNGHLKENSSTPLSSSFMVYSQSNTSTFPIIFHNS